MMRLALPGSILHFTAFLLTGIYNYSSVSATGALFTETAWSGSPRTKLEETKTCLDNVLHIGETGGSDGGER